MDSAKRSLIVDQTHQVSGKLVLLKVLDYFGLMEKWTILTKELFNSGPPVLPRKGLVEQNLC